MAPKGPYKLCTVNTVPTRAKLLIGRLIEDVKEEWTIEYVENAERKLVSVPFPLQKNLKQTLYQTQTLKNKSANRPICVYRHRRCQTHV